MSDAEIQALLDKLANGYIAAEGTGPGNPRVKAGVMVNVTGVGRSFSGVYRVATSMHVLRGGSSYVMQFANSPSHTILGAVGAAGPAQPAFGAQLVLGVVTNTNDPDDMGRVRVRYPALSGDAEGAREIEKELAPIIEALSVANPIPVKAALNMLGHDVGGHRLPLLEATEAEKTALRGALERAGILAGARA